MNVGCWREVSQRANSQISHNGFAEVGQAGKRVREQGHSVLFRPAYQLVQELLAAKRDLVLPQKLRRLDSFELLILDDLGYVKQNPERIDSRFLLPSRCRLPHVNCYPAAERLRGGGGDGEATSPWQPTVLYPCTTREGDRRPP
ncbi:MAG: ATP-binding protein [Candidatus Binataceae bacterium]|jgi:hypothetical protein